MEEKAFALGGIVYGRPHRICDGKSIGPRGRAAGLSRPRDSRDDAAIAR